MTKHFHYTACGLDNVWLANGYTQKETRHGNAVAVHDVAGLHELIAQTLIDKRGRLTGNEFRFLRSQLGLSQEALGAMLDFSENAVSLWERKDTVPAACDQWLRISVLGKLEGTTQLADAIARTQCVHKLIYQKYVVKDVDGHRTVSVQKQPNTVKPVAAV
jgi:DNA-binding transcriptional regulator YiaG